MFGEERLTIWKLPGMMSGGLAPGPKTLATTPSWNNLLPTGVFWLLWTKTSVS